MCVVTLLLQLLCVTFLVTNAIDGFGFSLNNIRVRRQVNGNNEKKKGSSCPNQSDFQCESGECISKDKECDGTVNCRDGSDETNSCHRNNNSCIVPPHPTFGQWSFYSSSAHSAVAKPGQYVNESAILQVVCNSGFKADGKIIIGCEDGFWVSWLTDIGTCLKTCPPIYNSEAMEVRCRFKNEETENCTDALDSTSAIFKCAPFYENLQPANKPFQVCHNGSWDQTRPSCSPVCGQKTVTATVLIVNGTNVTRGNYPWQIAVYKTKSKVLICGGSLLNQRVILTAAHCVTNSKGRPYPKENYIVAAGKYFRKFDDPRDVDEAQFSLLHNMYVHSDYRGEILSYLSDIAILVTEKTFTLSLRVQPVCVDWDSQYIQNINETNLGYVTGWGFTEQKKNPSEVLKELKIPAYVSFEKCQDSLPEDFDRFLTPDKLCAGYLDRASSVCKGDSGGGLVYKVNKRYYITGIVSIAPSPPSGGCDSQQYGLYTSVQKYVANFIASKETEFRP